jgi:hypothetical protein
MVVEYFVRGLRSLGLVAVLGAAALAVGCAGSMTSARLSRLDVRDTVTAPGASRRLLLAGPGRLLHVDVERRNVVTVYRVPRHDGTAADCGNEPPRADAVIEVTAGALEVPRDESVCVLMARRASLSWHVRHVPATGGPVVEASRHASLP